MVKAAEHSVKGSMKTIMFNGLDEIRVTGNSHDSLPIIQLVLTEWALEIGRALTRTTVDELMAEFPKVRYGVQAFPLTAQLLGISGGPRYGPPVISSSQKVLQLNAQEQEDLIWQAGDAFELISGTISFTVKREYREHTYPGAPAYTQCGFFFQSSNSAWGSKEWFMTMDAQLPNGPALLLVYTRGSTGNAYGIVSMVNRSWVHLWPFRSSNLLASSSRMQTLLAGERKIAMKAVGGALLGGIVTGGLLGQKGAKMATKGAAAEQNQIFDQISGTARSLMHRIATHADDYWQGSSGNGQSQKL